LECLALIANHPQTSNQHISANFNPQLGKFRPEFYLFLTANVHCLLARLHKLFHRFLTATTSSYYFNNNIIIFQQHHHIIKSSTTLRIKEFSVLSAVTIAVACCYITCFASWDLIGAIGRIILAYVSLA
jgi:hypothetical protein